MSISHIFFADDALIFCEPNVNTIFHLRCTLLCFQMVSHLKINLKKTKMVWIDDRRDEASLAMILGYKVTNLPIKYLSLLPPRAKYKYVSTWEPSIDMFNRRMTGWKRNFLLKARRPTLIKSTLINLSIYYLPILTIPASIAKSLENIQCRFL